MQDIDAMKWVCHGGWSLKTAFLIQQHCHDYWLRHGHLEHSFSKIEHIINSENVWIFPYFSETGF
jgi:cAMP phosphodiesterase